MIAFDINFQFGKFTFGLLVLKNTYFNDERLFEYCRVSDNYNPGNSNGQYMLLFSTG